MQKIMTLFALLAVLAFAGSAIAMDDMTKDVTGTKAADHSTMDHGSKTQGETFVHAAMVDGLHAEFQVMDLAAMNITDPEGKTHHVMATFMKDGKKIEDAAGKLKLIAPSGKEQTAAFKNFGGGVFAANFLIDEDGKWGVICLFKEGQNKHTVKFWYPHGGM